MAVRLGMMLGGFAGLIPAEPVLTTSMPYHRDSIMIQQGILRTNCVDCLDRTNAAQFAIAKRAFGHQLYALGFLESPNLPFGCDAVQVLTEMYHDHGDTLAWQYTGSALVNRVDTYRRPHSTQWNSHSRDLLENIRRFYSNSMLDADKQAAMNLFLGIEPQPHRYKPKDRDYRHWYDPKYLERPKVNTLAPLNDTFKEYYKPHILSSFARLYAFTMNSSAKFDARNRSDQYISPFEPRPEFGNLPSTVHSRVRTYRSASQSSFVPTPGTDLPSPPASPPMTVHPTVPSRADEGPMRKLVSELYEPPNLDQRTGEYDWWVHYDPSDYRPMAKDMALYQWAVNVDEHVRLPPGMPAVSSADKWREWEALEGDEGDGGEWWKRIPRDELAVYERAVHLDGLFEE